MKQIFSICIMLLIAEYMTAQPVTKYYNNANRHTDFIGYSTRPLTESRDTLHEPYVLKLKNPETVMRDGIKCYDYTVSLSVSMLERETILRTSGGRNSHAVYVNRKFIGTARDSRVPSEFVISKALTDGENLITVAILNDDDTPEEMMKDNRPDIEQIYLLARPRLRIHDCLVSALPDSLGKNGLLNVGIVLKSTYNFEEPIKVGYDIYSPENKLKDYSVGDFTVAGNATDTATFQITVTDLAKHLWSSENPSLYPLMLYVKRGLLITEYVQFKIGFGTTSWDARGIYRNGKLINMKPARYNAASNEKTTRKEIAALKKGGFNTIYVDYPQPSWFYETCNSVGMYVVDRANINTDPKGDDRTAGGTVSNDPQWLDEYLNRVQAMYYRGRMYPCIIAWSLGGDSGNGYNMYKAYQWLKSTGDSRPVVYAGAKGEWNSDLELPSAR